VESVTYQVGLARHGPRVAWLRGSVFRVALNTQTEGCVSRRALRLTTVRQGEQRRGRRHMLDLHPPSHVALTIGDGSSWAQTRPRPSDAAAPRAPGQSRSGRVAVTAAVATIVRPIAPPFLPTRDAHAPLVVSRSTRLARFSF
jgi:hypothetical protein